MILPLLAAQAAVTTPAPASTSFSILQPVGTEPCVKRGKDGKPVGSPEDIIVCGKPLPSQKLPYPNEVVLNEPRPSNPYMTGTGAMAVEDGAPCGSVQRGCTSGLDLFGGGTQVVRLIQKVVAPGSCCERPGEASDLGMLVGDMAHGVKRALARKSDKSKRVAIPMDDAPPKSVILP